MRKEVISTLYNIYQQYQYSYGLMIIIIHRWRYDRGGVPRLGGEHPARPHGEERPRPLRGDACPL